MREGVKNQLKLFMNRPVTINEQIYKNFLADLTSKEEVENLRHVPFDLEKETEVKRISKKNIE